MKISIQKCAGFSPGSGYAIALGLDYLLTGNLRWIEIQILFVSIGLYWGEGCKW